MVHVEARPEWTVLATLAGVAVHDLAPRQVEVG
jgi:hypothetical protein